MSNQKNIIFGTGPLGLWVMRTFGADITPHEMAIKETVAWYHKRIGSS